MIKIVLNFGERSIRMHCVTCFLLLLIIRLIIYIFIIKIVFNFKCINAFAWVISFFLFFFFEKLSWVIS